MITLTGPGGAGKSTVGSALARHLEIPFIDLDRRFAHEHGEIGLYIGQHGYRAYTKTNVETYISITGTVPDPSVIALSSGFMTYAGDIHSEYFRLWHDIAASASTFVLIPSLDLELCVQETVRRQLRRPFARSQADEEAVIRNRFRLYVDLPARKIETMRQLPAIVNEIALALR